MTEPANYYPKNLLKFRAGASQIWQSDSVGESEQAIPIEGFWGFHRDYQNAFADSLEVLPFGGLTANATSLVVMNINGQAGDMITPRFQAGHLLRIDDELIMILATTISAGPVHTLTLSRAVNGTTAAAHLAAAPIKIYRVWENVNFSCVRLAAWRYRQKDADAFDTQRIIGSGVQVTPVAMPADVVRLLPAPKPMRLQTLRNE